MASTGKWVAYYRVSTAKQGASGLGLEAQQAAVREYLNGGNWQLVSEHVEIESGKNDLDRPQLQAALKRCKLTGSKLIISKLDRLSRDAHFLLGLEKAGVDFVAVDMPTANRLTVRLMAVIAEEERHMISARTKAALAAAKARGTKLGGFRGVKVDSAAGRAAQTERSVEFAQRVLPVILPMRDRGDSLRTIASALTAQGVMTARGGAWTAAAVSEVLKRV
jgi:DNA invertase Pin-like site-specific DNA recombinase